MLSQHSSIVWDAEGILVNPIRIFMLYEASNKSSFASRIWNPDQDLISNLKTIFELLACSANLQVRFEFDLAFLIEQ